MTCDMCGKDTKLFKIKIENAIMSVCENCSKFGDVFSEVVKKIEIKPIKKKIENEAFEIIKEGYGFTIKKAREKLGLKQEELAKQIKEKASLIHKLENELIEPNLVLAKKLEKFLRIKLIEHYKEEKKKIDFEESGEMTIGDLLNDKSK